MQSIKVVAAGVVTTDPYTVTMLSWSGVGAQGDSLVVVDNSGRDIWRSTAPSANYDLTLAYGASKTVVVNGINVTSLGSGTLTIYYE